jgi:uridine monophosphate synthetase
MIAAEGCEIVDSIVLVDREEGGIENLKNAGVTVHYVAKVTELTKELFNNNIINEEEYSAVLKQIGTK